MFLVSVFCCWTNLCAKNDVHEKFQMCVLDTLNVNHSAVKKSKNMFVRVLSVVDIMYCTNFSLKLGD